MSLPKRYISFARIILIFFRAYAPDLVIRVIVCGISGYHNEVPPSMSDEKCGMTSGNLNFITPVHLFVSVFDVSQ